MKPEIEVLAEVRRQLCVELEARLTAANQRLPTRCEHNYRHPLDARKLVDGEANSNYNHIATKLPVIQQTIGLCMLGAETPDEWPGNICEDPVDAQRCPYFTCKTSKSEIWESLAQDLSDPVWLETHIEIRTLLWVCELASVGFNQIPWWRRLWFWLTPLKLEAPITVIDPIELLPPKEEEL